MLEYDMPTPRRRAPISYSVETVTYAKVASSGATTEPLPRLALWAFTWLAGVALIACVVMLILVSVSGFGLLLG
jgi:hypothetical protein